MHINLILETERRSASLIPPAVIVKLVAGVVVLGVVSALISFCTSYRALRRETAAAAEQWRSAEVKYKAALALRTDLAVRNDLHKEITGWRDTRIAWGAQLETLQDAVPSLIQLNELQVSHDLFITSNNIPARVYELRLAGRTGAARSEATVGELVARLRQAPLDEWIESAVIPPGRFRQDSQVKTDRVFEIVCKYKPRRFE